MITFLCQFNNPSVNAWPDVAPAADETMEVKLNMEKKSESFIRLVLVLLVPVLFLAGCSADNPYVDAWNQGASIAESKLDENEFYQDHLVKEYFEQVGTDRNYAFDLYRDLRTDVMYVKYTFSSYNKGGASFSVMYAADGTPLLYSEWLALETDQEGGAAE